MKGTMNSMQDVPDNYSFEPVPEGNYFAQITEIKEKTSKNGDPMMNLTLTICTGDYQKRTVFDNILISDNDQSPGWKMRWRAKQFLKAINEEHKGDSFEWDSDRWLNKKCKVILGIEMQTVGKYSGDNRNVVNKYEAITPEEIAGNKDLEEIIPF